MYVLGGQPAASVSGRSLAVVMLAIGLAVVRNRVVVRQWVVRDVGDRAWPPVHDVGDCVGGCRLLSVISRRWWFRMVSGGYALRWWLAWVCGFSRRA